MIKLRSKPIGIGSVQAYYISMEILDGKSPEADDQYGEKLKAVTPQDLERLTPLVFRHDEHLIVIVE